jgi:ribosomal protein L11 methyltransferase
MNKVPVFEYFPDASKIELNLPGGGEATIEINPGWAFGKGYHPTTKLCVNALQKLFRESYEKHREIGTVLDVGCGSGILTLCALALGAQKATGVDIDNAIVQEAESNVFDNGFESRAQIILGSIEDTEGIFDLVVANILIGSILAISDEIGNRVKPGGHLLLSGIKEEEKSQVLDKFTSLGFSLQEESGEKEWVALLFVNMNTED